MQNLKAILTQLERFDETTQRNILVQFAHSKGLVDELSAFIDKEYGQDDEGDYNEDKAYAWYK